MSESIIDVPIVDAHHHLARLDLGYPWLAPDAPIDRYHGDDRDLRRNYLVSDYLADVADLPVIASVHVENGAADPVAEARWIGEVIAESAPIPAVHVCRADLTQPDVSVQLETLASMQHVRGVRQILNWHQDPRKSHTPRPGMIDEPQWRSGFAQLATLGLSFDLQVFADQLTSAAALAADHPTTQIVLDHIGMPLSREPEYLHEWAASLRLLAERPNVVVKVSAIGTTDHFWTPESIAPLIHQTIDAFGPDRVMFGSNFPVDGMYSSMTALYGAFAGITRGYSRMERAEMFAGTAIRAYRLDVSHT
ncbi:amidohydrolase [Microbacterium aoyamense]|uniref:Amidohydrolase n=1 Tax=Microbacterium aoyamense TaxID=344166 RepID=A0ABP5BB67_9MICO|nr:amidohydrolase family protein [Microbacterium aoyamense]